MTQAVVVLNELEKTARLQVELRCGANANLEDPMMTHDVFGMDEVGKDEDGDLFGEAREDEADGQGDEISEGEVEDMAPKRVAPDPGMPSQAEVDEHEVDHVPFRQWCEECVKGRGTGEPHGPSEGVHELPVVEFDYLFCTNSQIYRREELDEESKASATTILVVKERKTKAIFAHVVPQKGVDEQGIQWPGW